MLDMEEVLRDGLDSRLYLAASRLVAKQKQPG